LNRSSSDQNYFVKRRENKDLIEKVIIMNVEDSPLAQILILESLPDRISAEDRLFLTERGFAIVEGRPAKNPSRPYVVLTPGEHLEMFYGVSDAFNVPQRARPSEFIGPGERSVESLASLVATMALDTREYLDMQKKFPKHLFPNNPGQPFLLFVTNDIMMPVAEKLVEQYGGKKIDYKSDN
jgi:hypothetical protein